MIAFDYPTTAGGQPGRLSAAKLAALADGLRQRIAGGPVRVPTIDAIIARTAALTVNGRPMRLAWDIAHDVRDDEERPALGACLHDPSEPGMVMVYVNGPQLADRPDVLRSTAVHELAHALFDMPAAVEGTARRVFRTSVAHSRAAPGAAIDWVEWRADEFMGAFLVPADKLARAVTREAGAIGLRLRWRTDTFGRPTPFVDDDPRSERIGWLVDQLADAFGVSRSFMAARLRRGCFIGRPSGMESAR